MVMRSSSERCAPRYSNVSGTQVGDGLEQVVELFGLLGVVLGSVRQVEKAIFEPRVRHARVRAATGTLREGEQLADRHVDLLEQRRAAHGFEQAARGEERVRLRAPELDLARHLRLADAPQERATRPGCRALQIVLALHLGHVAPHRPHAHAECVGELVQGEAARVPSEDVSQAIEPSVLGERAVRPSALNSLHAERLRDARARYTRRCDRQPG